MKTFLFIIGLFISVFFGSPTESYSQWKRNNYAWNSDTFPRVNSLLVSGESIFAGTTVGVFRSNDGGQTWTICNSGLLNLNIQFLAIFPNGQGGNNLLAGSWGSGVFLSTNNGTNWFQSNAGLTNSLTGCIMISDTNLFVGTNGGLFLSTNYGKNWSLVNSGLVHPPIASLNITCLAMIGSNLFAGTFGGGVFLSTNNGTSWTPVNSGMIGNYSLGISSLAVVGTNIFATTNDQVVYVSTDIGRNWTVVLTGDYYSLVSNGRSLFALGYRNIFISTDNGKNWGTYFSGLTKSYITCMVFGSNKIYVGTAVDGIFLSTNNGTSWSAPNPGLPSGEVRSFWVNNSWAPTDIWALTYGNIYHLSGSIWWPVAYYSTGPANPYFNCLVGVTDSTENAILVGTNDGITRSIDGGLNWVSVDSGLTNTFVNSMFVNDHAVFAGTKNGIFRSTNKGTVWIPVNDGLPNTSVNCFAEINQHLFSGTKEGIFKSTDNGDNWTISDSGLMNKDVNSIAVSGGNLIAGTANGMYLSTNTALSWTILNSGFPASAAVYCFTARGSAIFAGTQNGVFLSTNNGINWANVNYGLTDSVVYSLAISGKDIFAAMHGNTIWSRLLIEMGITSVKSSMSMAPNEIVLNHNYPNPFNSSTLISYQLASVSHVTLKVFDVLGREVKTLVNERQNVGDHSVTFNASDLSNGVYFYSLQVGINSKTRKLIVLK